MLTMLSMTQRRHTSKPVIDEMATEAEDLGLGENGAYASHGSSFG